MTEAIACNEARTEVRDPSYFQSGDIEVRAVYMEK